MIQRIQSLYLAICSICLICLLFGLQLVTFSNKEYRYDITGLKIQKFDLVSGSEIYSHFHFGAFILLVLLLSVFVTLFNFKNLKKQFKLGRSLFFTYFLVLVGTLLWISFGKSMIDEDLNSRTMGVGFLLFVIGFPFTFLANTGIKRDKTLLDSIDRIR